MTKTAQIAQYANIVRGSIRAAYECSAAGAKAAAVANFQTADNFRRKLEALGAPKAAFL